MLEETGPRREDRERALNRIADVMIVVVALAVAAASVVAFFSGRFSRMCSSRSCFDVTGEGAAVSRSSAR